MVFTASAEELTAALAKEQAAPDAPQDEEELLTAAVNLSLIHIYVGRQKRSVFILQSLIKD